MFLKSIEIRGFKSFADKTVLNFKEGVTAVVGPNGSGKSNISDAVRWVLGEQSAKTLRGGKMEDIIFAGTQFRKPVGLAQVSLTLDNSDNSLETEYSEVTVTRRIFRSGETEYLINNQKCRLKDINNLFMDTGIGKEGYSLIGQGKIEAILSGKAEDRRSLLEEAAGIVKYKTRKEEAERRLANTENNLVRIRDIIHTYEERIEPLKEEREKALKYKTLADELKIKEVSLLVENIKKVEKDLEDIEKDIDKRTEEIKEKREELELEKREFINLEKSIEALENKNQNEKEEYYAKKDELNENYRNIEIFKERISNLEGIINKNLLEINELKESLNSLEKEKNTLLESLQEKIKEQMKKENDINIMESNIKSLSKDIEEFEKEASVIKDDEFEFLSKISETKNKIAIISKEITNKEDLSLNSENSLKVIKDNIKINLATIEGLNRKISECKEEKKSLEENILKDKKKLSSIIKERSKSENKIREILKNINIFEGKLTTLKDLEKNYEGYNLSVKRLMERIQEGKISGSEGTKVLGEIFQVDKKYETAIEIALGGAISNIITKDEEVAKKLINYLKINSLGRATFLPLSIIKGNRLNILNQIRDVEGFLGLASDLLIYDPIYKGIIDYALGKTIIASDMDSALKISKAYNHKVKIVTLEGEVISPGGALTGGSIYKKNKSSILGRKRELQELEERLRLNKSEYTFEVENFNKLKAEINELDEKILNYNDELHIKNIDIAKFESEELVLDKEKHKLKTSLEVAENEINLNKDNLEKLKVELEKNKEILLTLEKDSLASKNRVSELEKIIREKRKLYDTKKEEVVKIKIDKASLDESVYSTQSEIKRKDKDAIERKEKIDKLNREIKEQKETIEKLQRDIEEKLELIGLINKRLEELEEVFKRDEINRITLKDKSKIKNEIINKLVEEIQHKESELNKKEIVFARFENERENCYKKLNEEQNLTLAEACEIALHISNISEVKESIKDLKNKIANIGVVNLKAISEYEEVCEKYEFMAKQEEDLNKSKEELITVINEMTEKMKELFIENFKIINENFNETFRELFKGGNAELILGEGDELSANIDINVQPPGKKLQNINLMSGGEKVLSAIALLFSILKMKPTPFCILDEIEAALDDANVIRYAEFLKKFSENIQFIVITHRKGTMEASDIMYGVTMEEKGISKVVSVDLNSRN